MSWMVLTPCSALCWAVKAETATGVRWTFTERFSAVTITSLTAPG
jgi:hypothetical protein